MKEIFLAACERPAGERGPFLDQACGDDAELRRAIDALLAADEETPSERTEDVEAIEGYRLVRRVGEGGRERCGRPSSYSPSAELAQTLHATVMIHVGTGEIAEAQRLLRASIDMAERAAGPRHAYVSRGYYNLACLPGESSFYFSDDPRADLEAYAGLFLQQEIIAEGTARSAPAFSRFLKVAALCNGTVVNFTNVASDAQVPRTTVYEYFEILKDTLLVHELPPWKRSGRRKPIVSSKYYFFDVGVVGTLQGRAFRAGTPEFGEAFETYLLHELVCHRDYVSEEPLAFWRTTSGFEVDFLIGDHSAVEAKAKTVVSPQDLRSLRALADETKIKRRICVCLEQRPRTVEGVRILPLVTFLDELWSGAYR